MRQYENPKIELQVGADYLEDMKDCVMTISSQNKFLPPYVATYYKGDMDINAAKGTISIQIRQSDGQYFEADTIPSLQLNILYSDGERIVSRPAKLTMLYTAYKEVMTTDE